jgi:hypothetical protein
MNPAIETVLLVAVLFAVAMFGWSIIFRFLEWLNPPYPDPDNLEESKELLEESKELVNNEYEYEWLSGDLVIRTSIATYRGSYDGWKFYPTGERVENKSQCRILAEIWQRERWKLADEKNKRFSEAYGCSGVAERPTSPPPPPKEGG